MFTHSEIKQFRSEGWVAKDEFWNAREVAAMRAELDRLKAARLLRHQALYHRRQIQVDANH